MQLVVIRPNVSLHAVSRGAALFGEKADPPLACPPSWESWSTGRLPVSLLHGLSVRPPTDLIFVVFGSARADHRLEPCRLIESLGELWWARGKTARHPLSLCAFGRVLGMEFDEETPTSWGRLPLASPYSPGGSGVVVHSPGRRSGPTLPHREAKVSGVGSP